MMGSDVEQAAGVGIVSEDEFPLDGCLRDQFEFLLRYAILSPSTRNTQPWKFALSEHGVEVYADYTRRLPTADPGNRELLMSAGAAVFTLRLAAARFGFACRVDYDYSGRSERPLAMVSLAPASPGVPVEEFSATLFPAIIRRQTNRHRFLLSRVASSVLAHLRQVGGSYQATLRISTDGKLNEQVAEIVAEGDRRLLADPAYRKEVAEWVYPDQAAHAEGMPASAIGTGGILSSVAPWATKVLDLGRIRAARDKNLCAEAPVLIAIGGDDAPPAWLETGELLQHLLLSVTVEGLHASYFNMPLQVPELRLTLRALLGLDTWPQLLLRVGYCFEATPRTPRRPVHEFLIT